MFRRSALSVCCFAFLIVGVVRADDAEPSASRLPSGLQLLYTFDGTGDVVRDRSGVGVPVDLRIDNPGGVRRKPGSLEIVRSAKLISTQPPSHLREAVRRSGEITIEAWITPANTTQDGPARIVSCSKNTNERNFTLGQEADRFDVRLRTTKTSKNGMPSLASSSLVTPQRTHVVYTRQRDGRTTIYVNGTSNRSGKAAGSLDNWDPKSLFVLGNEASGDRQWLGTFHAVALYSRALSKSEVVGHHRLGPNRFGHAGPLRKPVDPEVVFFREHVAPLLVGRCFDCHDAATHAGGLDLSSRSATFKGGDSGAGVVPQSLSKSHVWKRVAADEMPENREPLTKDEKAILKRWIERGASWPGERIDPVLYSHSGSGSQRWVRRLTLSEYVRTVRAVTGVDIADAARATLPPDLRADGFSNTAYNLTVDLPTIAAYAQLAEQIVSAVDLPEFLSTYEPSRKTDRESLRRLVRSLGRDVLRGPVRVHEEDAYVRLAQDVVASSGSFEEAGGYVLEAMLQSPRFLYLMERQAGDGSTWPVTPHELACRISYALWGAPPDRELAAAADDGALDSDAVRKHVARMLRDPRARERSLDFAREWLHLSRLDSLRPDAKRFREWDAELGPQMREETLRFFEQVVWTEDRPLWDLLDADVTFLTPELAKHYRIPLANGHRPGTWRKYDLSDTPSRGGLLTQGSLLTLGGDDASMVTRGLFVLHDLLRGVVNDPPPCVETTPVPSRPGVSQRMVSQSRLENQACAGCHVRFEPLAFGLEQFDGLGTHRTRDEFGNRLREDGAILFPGQAEPTPFETSAELMERLADSDRVRRALTWKLAQFVVGRPLGAGDASIIESVHDRAAQRGGRWGDILTELLLSELVQYAPTESLIEDRS